jgi:DNA-3-methyladenine glycosylase I
MVTAAGAGTTPESRNRCPWANGPWLRPYHDLEWGVPVHEDDRHLELLVLEGAQAGLSWLTILRRREGYRRVFARFDPEQVATFTDRQVEALLVEPAIIRHRRKIEAAVANARALVLIQADSGSFDDYVWSFVGGSPLVNHWRSLQQVPALTDLSRRLSLDLRRRGFHFVGPTVCYSYLQAAGLINDHLTGCYRFLELAG